MMLALFLIDRVMRKEWYHQPEPSGFNDNRCKAEEYEVRDGG
jgi:hypothetical protein